MAPNPETWHIPHRGSNNAILKTTSDAAKPFSQGGCFAPKQTRKAILGYSGAVCLSIRSPHATRRGFPPRLPAHRSSRWRLFFPVTSSHDQGASCPAFNFSASMRLQSSKHLGSALATALCLRLSGLLILAVSSDMSFAVSRLSEPSPSTAKTELSVASLFHHVTTGQFRGSAYRFWNLDPNVYSQKGVLYIGLSQESRSCTLYHVLMTYTAL
jgi:hypothetical protein